MALKMGNGVHSCQFIFFGTIINVGVKVEWTIKENCLWEVGNFVRVIT